MDGHDKMGQMTEDRRNEEIEKIAVRIISEKKKDSNLLSLIREAVSEGFWLGRKDGEHWGINIMSGNVK